MNYFVTAIGTDSGKTVVSSILSLALNAEYWKPVQAGFPTDTETVKALTENKVYCHPEQYVLNTPASPHAAAPIDHVEIKLEDFHLPNTHKNLVIEGAGGIMVPLNGTDLVIDLAIKFKTATILVSNNYLGSINHTLLSLEYLKSKKISAIGIIFNGPANKATEEIILLRSKLPCLLKVPQLQEIKFAQLLSLSKELKKNLNELAAEGS